MMTALAVLAWLGIYAVLETKNIAFARNSTMTAFAAGCALASLAVTYWLWPACTSVPAAAAVRAGGLAGVKEGWVTILLFATSLAIFFGFAHRFQHAHAAIGRLAALPIVPLSGPYTVATVLEPDPPAFRCLNGQRAYAASTHLAQSG